MVIDRARQGEFEIVLTPQKPVPAEWFPELDGCNVLCLASGGGQQAPVLAAAGANVTVYDNSPMQLAQDRMVADRDSLQLTTVEGDMRDLSEFGDATFDLIFHPCSISFIPDVERVWPEVFRVLRPGGTYLLGACNPLVFVFDYDKFKTGDLVFRHSIPYSDLESLNQEELDELKREEEPFCFGHSLEQIIGGQVAAGFHIIGFYEDVWGEEAENHLDKFIPSMLATRALKPL